MLLGKRSPPSGRSLAAFAVPFALLLFLAINNGGYGIEERSIAGILTWAGIALALALGLISVGSFSGSTTVALCTLLAFGVWTFLSFTWTENDEHTAVEVARVASYLGFFALAVLLHAREHGREVIGGITAALTLVCALGLASRLEPTWFPERVSAQYLAVPEIERRLSYPLNYAGGVVSLAAMTLPLLAAQVWSAGRPLTRALAAAAMPAVVITLWLTASGLLFFLSTAGLVAYLSFTENRIGKVVTLAAALLGGLVLCLAVESLDALDRGLPTPEALAEGDRLLVYVVVVMIVVGLLTSWAQAAVRRRAPPSPRLASDRHRRLGIALLGVAFATTAAAFVLSSDVVDRGIERFKSRENVPGSASRFRQATDFGSSGRFQQWQAALDAHDSEPLTGIGAGTFEFWWSRNGAYGGYVRDAHSLYIEALAELGWPGFLLVVGFVLGVLIMAANRALRAPPSDRTVLAGSLGACVAFALAAGIDWVWELGVLPAAFLMLAAVGISPQRGVGAAPTPPPREAPPRRAALGLGFGLAALLAAALIWVPLKASIELRSSEQEFAAGDFQGAYDAARRAEGAEPFAAGPRLQQALVLEKVGEIEAAIEAAQAAVERAPTDWRPRLILARLYVGNEEPTAALASFREARELNPFSVVFQR